MKTDPQILSSMEPFVRAASGVFAASPETEQIFVQSDYSARPDGRYDYCALDIEFVGQTQRRDLHDVEAARFLRSWIWRLPHLIPFNTEVDRGPLETVELMIDRQIGSLKIQMIGEGYDRQALWRLDDPARIKKQISAWLSIDFDLTAHRRLELARYPDPPLQIVDVPADHVRHFKPIGINMIDECFAIIDLDPAADLLSVHRAVQTA